MRGTLDQTEFQAAVSLVQGIAQTKLANPVVENIVLRFEPERAEILATNLSISIRVRIGIESGEEGEIALPAKILGQLIRELPAGPVQLELAGREIKIDAGRSHFHLSAIDTGDFPPFLPEVEGTAIEIPVEETRRALDQTVFATSEERARYQLGGVKFLCQKGEAKWVATDGRRLSMVKRTVGKAPEQDCGMLLPAKAAQELLRALPDTGTLYMTLGERRVLFEAENLTVASTLLEDNFPPYETLIASEFPIQVRADRDELMASVRRASVLASEKTRLVHLEATDGRLIVRGERQEAGGGESEIDAKTDGAEINISYNAGFLSDCLKAVGSGEVTWGLVQEGGAGYFFREDDPSFLHIIMPMTVREEPEQEEDEGEDD